jgi:hypothetical protein
MSLPQSCYAKNHLDCGARPIRVPAGIDPRRSAAPIRGPKRSSGVPQARRRETTCRMSRPIVSRLGFEMLHRLGAVHDRLATWLRMTRGEQRYI